MQKVKIIYNQIMLCELLKVKDTLALQFRFEDYDLVVFNNSINSRLVAHIDVVSCSRMKETFYLCFTKNKKPIVKY